MKLSLIHFLPALWLIIQIDSACINRSSKCVAFRQAGKCHQRGHIKTARRNCAAECGFCLAKCADRSPKCPNLVPKGFCRSRKYIHAKKVMMCADSCKLCGNVKKVTSPPVTKTTTTTTVTQAPKNPVKTIINQLVKTKDDALGVAQKMSKIKVNGIIDGLTKAINSVETNNKLSLHDIGLVQMHSKSFISKDWKDKISKVAKEVKDVVHEVKTTIDDAKNIAKDVKNTIQDAKNVANAVKNGQFSPTAKNNVFSLLGSFVDNFDKSLKDAEALKGDMEKAGIDKLISSSTDSVDTEKTKKSLENALSDFNDIEKKMKKMADDFNKITDDFKIVVVAFSNSDGDFSATIDISIKTPEELGGNDKKLKDPKKQDQSSIDDIFEKVKEKLPKNLFA